MACRCLSDAHVAGPRSIGRNPANAAAIRQAFAWPPDVLERQDDDGKTVADWLRRYGQDPAQFADARIPRGSLAAYVELHIEQGGVLDERHVQIGVVQGIVGVHRWTCAATGFANHAGTTPMDRRQDALAGAARAVLAVREEVRAEAGRQVGTVGYVRVEPGAVNVIPGRVEFPVELRDLDATKALRIWARIEKRFVQIAREENVKLDCVPAGAQRHDHLERRSRRRPRRRLHSARPSERRRPRRPGDSASRAYRNDFCAEPRWDIALPP